MKKLKIFPLLAAIMTALSLTACLPEKKPVSVYEQYADVSENFGSDVVEGILGKKLGGTREVMNAENSEKFRSALHDIRINNSRIALPLMVCDLPEGFSVIYGDEYKLDGYDYSMFTGVLAFGESELGDVYIARQRGVSEQEGVIIGAMFNSDSCKWSVGEADSCDINALENAFGKPSGTEAIASENSSDHTYIADSGEFALFIPRINCAFVFAINCTQLEENKALCEYVPYDDFVGMTDLPPVSGEKTDFDGGAAFSEKGVVIGDFSCPANIAVGELENTDISLVYCETMPYTGVNVHNADSLIHDCYLVLYKGRYVGVCQSVRQEEESAENAPICFWRILDRESLPCDVSLAGIPASQTNESLEQCLIFDFGDEESGKLGTEGLYEADGELYYVGYIRSSSGYSSLLTDRY